MSRTASSAAWTFARRRSIIILLFNQVMPEPSVRARICSPRPAFASRAATLALRSRGLRAFRSVVRVSWIRAPWARRKVSRVGQSSRRERHYTKVDFSNPRLLHRQPREDFGHSADAHDAATAKGLDHHVQPPAKKGDGSRGIVEDQLVWRPCFFGVVFRVFPEREMVQQRNRESPHLPIADEFNHQWRRRDEFD